jgi:hypothetical protein
VPAPDGSGERCRWIEAQSGCEPRPKRPASTTRATDFGRLGITPRQLVITPVGFLGAIASPAGGSLLVRGAGGRASRARSLQRHSP